MRTYLPLKLSLAFFSAACMSEEGTVPSGKLSSEPAFANGSIFYGLQDKAFVEVDLHALSRREDAVSFHRVAGRPVSMILAESGANSASGVVACVNNGDAHALYSLEHGGTPELLADNLAFCTRLTRLPLFGYGLLDPTTRADGAVGQLVDHSRHTLRLERRGIETSRPELVRAVEVTCLEDASHEPDPCESPLLVALLFDTYITYRSVERNTNGSFATSAPSFVSADLKDSVSQLDESGVIPENAAGIELAPHQLLRSKSPRWYVLRQGSSRLHRIQVTGANEDALELSVVRLPGTPRQMLLDTIEAPATSKGPAWLDRLFVLGSAGDESEESYIQLAFETPATVDPIRLSFAANRITALDPDAPGERRAAVWQQSDSTNEGSTHVTVLALRSFSTESGLVYRVFDVPEYGELAVVDPEHVVLSQRRPIGFTASIVDLTTGDVRELPLLPNEMLARAAGALMKPLGGNELEPWGRVQALVSVSGDGPRWRLIEVAPNGDRVSSFDLPASASLAQTHWYRALETDPWSFVVNHPNTGGLLTLFDDPVAGEAGLVSQGFLFDYSTGKP